VAANDLVWARMAAGSLLGLLAVSTVLIALYSHRYFGTWTPPNSLGQPDWLHPRFGQVASLYGDMFFGRESGLLPWVPLDLLVAPGLIVLWRRSPRQGRSVALLLAAQLGAFVTAAVSAESQGKAIPARFTVESAPFFALCVAAVFALGAPALRRWSARLWNGVSRAVADLPGGQRFGVPRAWQPARHAAVQVARGVAASSVGATLAHARRDQLARASIALAAGALLGVTGWFATVGQRDPALLYPSPAGPRVVEEYPAALPAAWFALFPAQPAQWVTSGVVRFAPVGPAAMAVRDARGGLGVRGVAGGAAAQASLARGGPLLTPPGVYLATLTLACDARAGGSSAAQFSVLREWDRARPLVATRAITTATCQGTEHPVRATLRFTSNGYQPLTLVVRFAGTTAVVVWTLAYAPG
jgi:hypothetical protein